MFVENIKSVHAFIYLFFFLKWEILNEIGAVCFVN